MGVSGSWLELVGLTEVVGVSRSWWELAGVVGVGRSLRELVRVSESCGS